MKYINKLTYVSYDGFIEMDNIHNNYDSVLELDCKDITTEDKFWFYWVIGQKVCVTNPNKLENL